jgi:hypothetical protein
MSVRQHLLHRSVVYYVLTMCVVMTFCNFIGFGMTAKYSECDPLLTKQITRYDQLVPYYIKDIAAEIPGVFGLYVAAVFSATLRYQSIVLPAQNVLVPSQYNFVKLECFVWCHLQRFRKQPFKESCLGKIGYQNLEIDRGSRWSHFHADRVSHQVLARWNF